MPRPISPTLKAIKLRRVVGEDLPAHGRVRRPIEQQLEQVGILGRPGLARRGMRPVARPQHALRRMLHQRLREAPDVLVLWPAGFRSLVRRSSSASVTPGLTTATPFAPFPIFFIASKVTLLSSA